jgi:hypothetical protein
MISSWLSGFILRRKSKDDSGKNRFEIPIEVVTDINWFFMFHLPHNMVDTSFHDALTPLPGTEIPSSIDPKILFRVTPSPAPTGVMKIITPVMHIIHRGEGTTKSRQCTFAT